MRTLRVVAERRASYYAEGAFTTSGAVVQALRPYYDELDREVFGVVPLNQRNEPLGFHVVSVGTLTASLVHPRLCVATHKRGHVAAPFMWSNAVRYLSFLGEVLPDAT